MEKEQRTKTGLPETVLAAVIFFMGLESTLITMVLILYVLIFEDMIFVRKAAKRMLVWVMIFAAVNGIYNILILAVTGTNGLIGSQLHISDGLSTVIKLVKYVLYFSFGVQAIRKREVKIHFIDRLSGLLNEEDWKNIKQAMKNKFQNEKEKTVGNITTAIEKRERKCCKKCGQELADNAQFCAYCGEKQ